MTSPSTPFVLALCVATAGCSPPPPAITPVIEPIEYSAPACGEHGPSVVVLRAWYTKCGKGDLCTVLDLRITNPTDRALWLMVEGDEAFSGYLESVNILRPRSGREPVMWEFYGQNYDLAYRLLPGADVVVQNVEFSLARTEYRAVFVDRIELNYDRHLDWRDTEAALPLHGELEAPRPGGFSELRRSEPFHLDGKERVSLDTWCIETVPLHYDGS